MNFHLLHMRLDESCVSIREDTSNSSWKWNLIINLFAAKVLKTSDCVLTTQIFHKVFEDSLFTSIASGVFFSHQNELIFKLLFSLNFCKSAHIINLYCFSHFKVLLSSTVEARQAKDVAFSQF